MCGTFNIQIENILQLSLGESKIFCCVHLQWRKLGHFSIQCMSLLMFCVFSFFFFSWFDSKINYRVIPYVNGFNFSFFLALLSANRNMSRVLKVPQSNYSLSIVLKQVKTTVRTLYINISLLQTVGVCQTAIDKGPLGTRFLFFLFFII